jgi:hypothetical protein
MSGVPVKAILVQLGSARARLASKKKYKKKIWIWQLEVSYTENGGNIRLYVSLRMHMNSPICASPNEFGDIHRLKIT